MADLTTPERHASVTSSQNRQRLVEAALALFEQRGYHGTSIGDVAEQADLAKGHVSYYFATKAELLEYVTTERTRQLLDQLNAALPPGSTPRAELQVFLDVTMARASELARVGCPVGTLSSELGKDDHALQPYASAVLDAIQMWLHARFAALEREPQATEHAEHLLALMQGAAVLAHAARDPTVVVRIASTARDWLYLTVGRD